MVITLNDLSKLKGHTLVAWNCRSALPKIEEIERIKIESGAEFIGICESWLHDQIDDAQIQLDSYNMIRYDRTADSGKKSGGGLLLYYKSKLDCLPLSDLNYCSPHIEIIWIKLKLVNTRNIYYGLVYRPPTGSVELFINKLEEYVTYFRSLGLCEINIAGDVNLDLYQSNPKINTYKRWLRRIGLDSTINEATHIKNLDLGFSAIDHFISTDPHLYNTTGSIPTNASDHFFIFAVRKKLKIKHPKHKFVGRAYSRLDPEKFKTDMENHDWNQVLTTNNSDIAWNLFKSDFLGILHSHRKLHKDPD